MFDYMQLEYLFSELPQGRLVVGYSGGMDSHVLLHSLTKCKQKLRIGIPIIGLHIHHGLSPNADAWDRHCESVCSDLGAEYCCIRVEVGKSANGDGPEGDARSARYKTYEEFLTATDRLLLAHHQDDQIETILYRLFRGSGLKGIGGMPVERGIGSAHLVRPLLSVSREELRIYAEAQNLRWVEDESNFDQDMDRNYIRHQIVPKISAHWPAYRNTISRFAELAITDFQLLQELAAEDMNGLLDDRESCIDLIELRKLNNFRQRNTLLHWIDHSKLPAPTQAQLLTLVQQLNVQRPDAAQCVKWPGAEVRVFKQAAYLMGPLESNDKPFIWHLHEPKLTGGRWLIAEAVKKGGLADDGNPLTVRFRAGGERCQPHGRMGSHPLKKIFQEFEIPPWSRDRIPLIYRGDELVAVAGLFVCEGFMAPDDEVGWDISWTIHRTEETAAGSI